MEGKRLSNLDMNGCKIENCPSIEERALSKDLGDITKLEITNVNDLVESLNKLDKQFLDSISFSGEKVILTYKNGRVDDYDLSSFIAAILTKANLATPIVCDELPTVVDNGDGTYTITYKVAGVEKTTTNENLWFYYVENSVQKQTLFIGIKEITLNSGQVDISDLVSKTTDVLSTYDSTALTKILNVAAINSMISKSINSSSTDDEVASSKTVYTLLKRIPHLLNMNMDSSETISSGQNIGGVYKCGNYFIKTQEIAESLFDLPVKEIGQIIVADVSGIGEDNNGKDRLQIYITRTGNIYIRQLSTPSSTGYYWNYGDWIKLINSKDIVKVLDSSATDNQVPSAKAVHDSIKSNNIYLGTIFVNTDDDIKNIATKYNIPNESTYICSVHPSEVTTAPFAGYTATVIGMEYDNHKYGYQYSIGNGIISFRHLDNGSWGNWEKIATSTDISSSKFNQGEGILNNYTTILEWAYNNIGHSATYNGRNFDDCPFDEKNAWGTLACIGASQNGGYIVIAKQNNRETMYVRYGNNKSWVGDWGIIHTDKNLDVLTYNSSREIPLIKNRMYKLIAYSDMWGKACNISEYTIVISGSNIGYIIPVFENKGSDTSYPYTTPTLSNNILTIYSHSNASLCYTIRNV